MNSALLKKHVEKTIKVKQPALYDKCWSPQLKISFETSFKDANFSFQHSVQKQIGEKITSNYISMTSEKENLQMLKKYDQVTHNSEEWKSVGIQMEDIYSCAPSRNNGELDKKTDIHSNFIYSKSKTEETKQNISAILEHCVLDGTKPVNTEIRRNNKVGIEYTGNELQNEDKLPCSSDCEHKMCTSLVTKAEKCTDVVQSCTVKLTQSHSKVSIIRLRPASQNDDYIIENHDDSKIERSGIDDVHYLSNRTHLCNENKNTENELSSSLYHSDSLCKKSETKTSYCRLNSVKKYKGKFLTTKVSNDGRINRTFIKMKRSRSSLEIRSHFRHPVISQHHSKHKLHLPHVNLNPSTTAKVNSSVKGYAKSRYLLGKKIRENKLQTHIHRNFKRRRRCHLWPRQNVNITCTSKLNICNNNDLPNIKKETSTNKEDEIMLGDSVSKFPSTNSLNCESENNTGQTEKLKLKTENFSSEKPSNLEDNTEHPKEREMPPLLLPLSPASAEEISEEIDHSPDSPEMPTLIPFTTENEDPPMFIKSEGPDELFDDIPDELLMDNTDTNMEEIRDVSDLDSTNLNIKNNELSNCSLSYSPLSLQNALKQSNKESSIYQNNSIQQDSGYYSTPKLSPKKDKKLASQSKRSKKTTRRVTMHYGKRKKRRKSKTVFKENELLLGKETSNLQPLVVLKRIPQSVIDWYVFSYDSESCLASTAEAKSKSNSHLDESCSTADSTSEMELHLDVIDGQEFYSFLSEKDMEHFSDHHGHNLVYSNEISDYDDFEYVNDSVFQEHKQKGIIIPRKTKDITQIKGWRNKLFIQDSYLPSLKQEDNNEPCLNKTVNNVPSKSCNKEILKQEQNKNSLRAMNVSYSFLHTTNVCAKSQKQIKVSKPTFETEVKTEKLKMMEDKAKGMNTRSAFMSDILDDFLKTRSELRVGLLEKYNPNITPLPLDASILSVGLLHKPEERNYIPPSLLQTESLSSEITKTVENKEADISHSESCSNIVLDSEEKDTKTKSDDCTDSSAVSSEKVSKYSYSTKRKVHHFSGAYSKKLKRYCLNSIEHSAQRLVLKLKKEVKNGESDEYKVTMFSSVNQHQEEDKEQSSRKDKYPEKCNKHSNSKYGSEESAEHDLKCPNTNNGKSVTKNHYSGGIADTCTLPIIKGTHWSKPDMDRHRLSEFIYEWRRSSKEKSQSWQSSSKHSNFTCPVISQLFAERSLVTLLSANSADESPENKECEFNKTVIKDCVLNKGSNKPKAISSGKFKIAQKSLRPTSLKNFKLIKDNVKKYMHHDNSDTPVNLKARKKRSIRLPARYLDSALLVARGSEWVSPAVSSGQKVRQERKLDVSELYLKENSISTESKSSTICKQTSETASSTVPTISPTAMSPVLFTSETLGDSSNDESDSSDSDHSVIDNGTCARTVEYILPPKKSFGLRTSDCKKVVKDPLAACTHKDNSEKYIRLDDALKSTQELTTEDKETEPSSVSQGTSSINLRISNVTSLSSVTPSLLDESQENTLSAVNSSSEQDINNMSVMLDPVTEDTKIINTVTNEETRINESPSCTIRTDHKTNHLTGKVSSDEMKDAVKEISAQKIDCDVNPNKVNYNEVKPSELHKLLLHFPPNTGSSQRQVAVNVVVGNKVVPMVFVTSSKLVAADKLQTLPAKSLIVTNTSSPPQNKIKQPSLGVTSPLSVPAGSVTGNQVVLVPTTSTHVINKPPARNEQVILNSVGGYLKVMGSSSISLLNQHASANVSESSANKSDKIGINNNNSNVSSQISNKTITVPQIENSYSTCNSLVFSEKDTVLQPTVETQSSASPVVPQTTHESGNSSSLKSEDKSVKLPMVVAQVSLPVQQKSALNTSNASPPVSLLNHTTTIPSVNSKIIKPLTSPGSRLLVAKSLFPVPLVNKGKLNIPPKLSQTNVNSTNLEPVRTSDLTSVNSGVTCFKPSVTFVKLGDKYGNKFLPVVQKIGTTVAGSKNPSRIMVNIANDKKCTLAYNVVNDKNTQQDSSQNIYMPTPNEISNTHSTNQGNSGNVSKNDAVATRHPTIISLLNHTSDIEPVSFKNKNGNLSLPLHDFDHTLKLAGIKACKNSDLPEQTEVKTEISQIKDSLISKQEKSFPCSSSQYSNDINWSASDQSLKKSNLETTTGKNYSLLNKIKTEDCSKDSLSSASISNTELITKIKTEDAPSEVDTPSITSVTPWVLNQSCSSVPEKTSNESGLYYNELNKIQANSTNVSYNKVNTIGPSKYYHVNPQESKHYLNLNSQPQNESSVISLSDQKIQRSAFSIESHLENDIDIETIENNSNPLEELNSRISKHLQPNNSEIKKFQDSNQYDHNYPLVHSYDKQEHSYDTQNLTNQDTSSSKNKQILKKNNAEDRLQEFEEAGKEDSNISLEDLYDEMDDATSDSSDGAPNCKTKRERERRKRLFMLFNVLKSQSESLQNRKSMTEVLKLARREVMGLKETSVKLESSMQLLLSQRKALIMKYRELLQGLPSDDKKNSLAELVMKVKKESIYPGSLGIKYASIFNTGGDDKKKGHPSNSNFKNNALQVVNERLKLKHALRECDFIQDNTVSKQEVVADPSDQSAKEFGRTQMAECLSTSNTNSWNIITLNEGLSKTSDIHQNDADKISCHVTGSDNWSKDADLTKVAAAACKLFGPCVVRRVKLRNGQTVYAYKPYNMKDMQPYLPPVADTCKVTQEHNIPIVNELESPVSKIIANVTNSSSILSSLLCSNEMLVEPQHKLKTPFGAMMVSSGHQASHSSSSIIPAPDHLCSQKDNALSETVERDISNILNVRKGAINSADIPDVEDNTSVWISGSGEPCYVTRILSDEDDDPDSATDIPVDLLKKDDEELPTIVSFSTISEEEFLKPVDDKNIKGVVSCVEQKESYMKSSQKIENSTIINSTLNKEGSVRSLKSTIIRSAVKCSNEKVSKLSEQKSVINKVKGPSVIEGWPVEKNAFKNATAGFSVLNKQTLETKTLEGSVVSSSVSEEGFLKPLESVSLISTV